MSEIIFKDHVTAELQYVDGDEFRIVNKARCSTQTARVQPGEDWAKMQARDEGLLRSLVRERHGSPFESCKMSWMIEAPIFVAREAVRHRLSGWNEESGRYVELRPIFYVPGPDRHLCKIEGSKQMAYQTEPGTVRQYHEMRIIVQEASEAGWKDYQGLLDRDILREVARVVLPLNLFTHWSWELNLRSLTNMLSLRIRHPESHVESKPMIEIQMLAEIMERDFAEHFPTVWGAWNSSGRLPL